ncbi:hypothetical protein F5Y16DRAFT_373950 [Xylariaceae sp. FL0255]|nr:hypothetical protein F5Y16DRAFT_373950 [Xylariaceae sp. FL0255]
MSIINGVAPSCPFHRPCVFSASAFKETNNQKKELHRSGCCCGCLRTPRLRSLPSEISHLQISIEAKLKRDLFIFGHNPAKGTSKKAVVVLFSSWILGLHLPRELYNIEKFFAPNNSLMSQAPSSAVLRRRDGNHAVLPPLGEPIIDDIPLTSSINNYIIDKNSEQSDLRSYVGLR